MRRRRGLSFLSPGRHQEPRTQRHVRCPDRLVGYNVSYFVVSERFHSHGEIVYVSARILGHVSAVSRRHRRDHLLPILGPGFMDRKG